MSYVIQQLTQNIELINVLQLIHVTVHTHIDTWIMNYSMNPISFCSFRVTVGIVLRVQLCSIALLIRKTSICTCMHTFNSTMQNNTWIIQQLMPSQTYFHFLWFHHHVILFSFSYIIYTFIDVFILFHGSVVISNSNDSRRESHLRDACLWMHPPTYKMNPKWRVAPCYICTPKWHYTCKT